MKTLFIVLMLLHCGPTFVDASEKPRQSSKENILTDYREWKKGFHKFLSEYETLSSFERFTSSKNALKEILGKMQIFSEKTSVPLPQSTYTKAKSLLAEIEAERISRNIANPILKSSLKTLETTMDEMINRANL